MRVLRRWQGLGLALAVLVVGGAGVGVALGSAGKAPVTAATYTKPGIYSWKVPARVTKVTFTLYGGSGGNVVGTPNILIAGGGSGGTANATFNTKPRTVYEVVVGSAGQDAKPGGSWSCAIYGGGASGIEPNGVGFAGIGSGGGASDVRMDASGTTGCATHVPPKCGFQGRILVAGGGGGAAADTTGPAADGGAGGGVIAPQAYCAGVASNYVEGGAQTFGGDNANEIGSGEFGWAYDMALPSPAGGGGGGWFGGGSGTYVPTTSTPDEVCPGAGGSGFIDPLALSGSFPTGTHYGNGKVIIQIP